MSCRSVNLGSMGWKIDKISEESSDDPCWLGEVSDGDVWLNRMSNTEQWDQNGIMLTSGKSLNLERKGKVIGKSQHT